MLRKQQVTLSLVLECALCNKARKGRTAFERKSWTSKHCKFVRRLISKMRSLQNTPVVYMNLMDEIWGNMNASTWITWAGLAFPLTNTKGSGKVQWAQCRSEKKHCWFTRVRKRFLNNCTFQDYQFDKLWELWAVSRNLKEHSSHYPSFEIKLQTTKKKWGCSVKYKLNQALNTMNTAIAVNHGRGSIIPLGCRTMMEW